MGESTKEGRLQALLYRKEGVALARIGELEESLEAAESLNTRYEATLERIAADAEEYGAPKWVARTAREALAPSHNYGAAEDGEAARLMREYDRTVARLGELGLDIVKLRLLDAGLVVVPQEDVLTAEEAGDLCATASRWLGRLPDRIPNYDRVESAVSKLRRAVNG